MVIDADGISGRNRCYFGLDGVNLGFTTTTHTPNTRTFIATIGGEAKSRDNKKAQ